MDKKKLSKWILICAGIVVAVLAIGFIVLLNSNIGSEQVAKELESAGQAINGEITVSSVRGNPIVGYSIEGLSLTSPVGLGLSTEKIDLNLDLSGLLKRKGCAEFRRPKRDGSRHKGPREIEGAFPGRARRKARSA